MKLFLEKGFNGCSIQDITEAAGVPKGSFYNHFTSKEALAAEVLTLYGDDIPCCKMLSDRSIPALTRIKRYFNDLNRYYISRQERSLIGTFMAEVSDQMPNVRGNLQALQKSRCSHLTAAICDGQAEGTIRKDLNADDLAAFLIDGYEGAILRTRIERNSKALKACIKIILTSISIAA
jgi:TetR/AcrR family transcriptional regulator, transcriptional repressor for nem operon